MFDPQHDAAMGCISNIMPLHAPPAWRRRSASVDSIASGSGAAGSAAAAVMSSCSTAKMTPASSRTIDLSPSLLRWLANIPRVSLTSSLRDRVSEACQRALGTV